MDASGDHIPFIWRVELKTHDVALRRVYIYSAFPISPIFSQVLLSTESENRTLTPAHSFLAAISWFVLNLRRLKSSKGKAESNSFLFAQRARA